MEDRSGSETLRLVASMPSDKTAQVEDLFATSTNNKPLRTYSAKGKNRFSSSLPTLRYQPPPPNPGPRLKRFRVGRAKSWELKQTRPVAIEQLPTVQTEQEDAKSVHGRKASEEISRSSLGDAEDEITSPISPSSRSASCQSDDAEVLEVEDDDEDPLTLSQPLQHNSTSNKQSPNQKNTFRRRPFLLFDKLKDNGYKKLKQNTSPRKNPFLFEYQLGDGFSGREAKANGSKLLTRNGKTAVNGPHLGILDLTQSEPAAQQKRTRRRANLDNSFLPAAKRRAVRGPEAKTPRQPDIPANTAQPKVKISSSVLEAAAKTITAPATVQTQQEHHTLDSDTDGKLSRPLIPQAKAPISVLQPPIGTTIIQRSDDIQGKHDRVLKLHGITAKEAGHPSSDPQISDTPSSRLRASSESSAASLTRRVSANTDSKTRGPPRALRRFNTQ